MAKVQKPSNFEYVYKWRYAEIHFVFGFCNINFGAVVVKYLQLKTFEKVHRTLRENAEREKRRRGDDVQAAVRLRPSKSIRRISIERLV
jgi:hypothetical protein